MCSLSSKEVFRSRFFCWNATSILWGSLKCLIPSFKIIVQLKNCRDISTPVAVIWSRPNRDQSFVEHFLVALHHKLVSTSNQVKIIFVIKVVYFFFSKEETSSTRTYTPSTHLLRIRPHQITHWSFMGHFLLSIDCLNLIKSFNAW